MIKIKLNYLIKDISGNRFYFSGWNWFWFLGVILVLVWSWFLGEDGGWGVASGLVWKKKKEWVILGWIIDDRCIGAPSKSIWLDKIVCDTLYLGWCTLKCTLYN